MGLLESDSVLYTTTTDSKDTLDDYYVVFKAQLGTIEAHGGNPGYHRTLQCRHFEEKLKALKGED